MEDKVCILIPTRKRFDDFVLFADSWERNTSGKSVVVVAVDEDDNTYDSLIGSTRYPFIWRRYPSQPFLHILNKMAVEFCTQYSCLAFLEDDVTFNTPNWETPILEKIKELGDTAFTWTNDMLNYEQVMGVPFINSKIVQKLGFMSRPGFNTQMVDVYWLNLAKKLGTLHYFPEIITEHRHFTTHKRLKDDTSNKVQRECVGEIEYWRSEQYQIDFLNDYNTLIK